MELMQLKSQINTLEILCNKYNHFGLEMNALMVFILEKTREIDNYGGTDSKVRDLLGEMQLEINRRMSKANNYLYIPDRLKEQ